MYGRFRQLLDRLRTWGSGSTERALRASAVYVVRISDGRPTADTTVRVSPEGDFSQAMMAPDGRQVAFWGSRPGDAGFHLYCTDLEKLLCRQLTRGPSVNGHPAWATDSQTLVYFSSAGVSEAPVWRRERTFQAERPPTNIFELDLRTGRRVQLTFGSWVDERPAVSPTGDTVVFVSNRGGSLNLWKVDRGRDPEPVTSHSSFDYRPQFSPDGRLLAYFTVHPTTGRHQLAVLRWPDCQPLSVEPELRFRWVHGPFWSPDGTLLLVHALLEGESAPALWTIHLDSGVCTRLNVGGVTSCSHGSWDRNLRYLSFDTREDLHLEPCDLEPTMM